jgi:phosphoribosylaminoimidazolecarboxamide formyltransferase/IMP cyclohydrolase
LLPPAATRLGATQCDGLQARGLGLLLQTADNHELALADLKVVTRLQPTTAALHDLLFAWKVAKFVKSNAIVFCGKGGMTWAWAPAR